MERIGGDVNLTAVFGRNGVTIEFQIAIVNMQKARALANDGIVQALRYAPRCRYRRGVRRASL